LLGDIRMGAGELDSARRAFAAIPPETGHLFLHGLFQQGKILRAQENYAEMIRLFSDYAQSSPGSETPKPRLSEALYWIGWAHAQLEKPADAVPVFLSALERHGDDPHAAEIASILTQLERLAPHLDSAAHADFPLWLQQ